MPTASGAPSPDRLMQFAFGFAAPLIIETAIRHRVFVVLAEGAKSLEEICAETSASARGMRAVLNALVGLELLTKDHDGRYALTPESAAFLVPGKASFHGAFFLLTSDAMLPAWGKLHEITRSGRPYTHINRQQDGVPFFLRFVEDIFPIHYGAAHRLGEVLGVAKATAPLSVLDLAAGSGVWSIALAQQSPHVWVTAVDWPGVIPITQKVAARLGVADRKSPLPALIFAVNMLVNSDHGDTFSLDEIRGWLREAGFNNVRTVDAPGLAPLLILATKPNS